MTDLVVASRFFRKFLLSKPFVLAAAFCFALVVFEYVFLFQSYPRLIFVRHWEAADYLKLAIFCGLSLCSTVLFFLFLWAAFSSRIVLKAVYLVLFSAIIVVEYSYHYAFRRFSIMLDLTTALYTGVDLQMGTEAVFAYFYWLSLVPIVVFAVLLFISGKGNRRDIFSFISVIAAFILYFAVSTYFTSNHFYTPSLSNFARTTVSFPTGWYIGTMNGPPQGIAYAEPRAALTYKTTETPKNNIVFIVDESVRGDRLSINGNTRPTTPTLDALNKNGSIANWGIAASGTTCSSTANALLLTGLNQVPDKAFEVFRWPTIFQYARASGYRNHYFDGHTNVHWLGKKADIPDYGEWTKADDLRMTNRYERDAEIARRVKSIIEKTTGNFIWVHKYGVHLPYENSFPNQSYGARFNDGQSEYDAAQTEESVREIYDVALTYNLESFFSTLFNDGPNANTIYVYSSDHGQALRDNGSIASHCSETRSEAIVPLMMIAAGDKLPRLDTQFRASHSNIFATLLDLMSYPEGERKFPYSMSLLRATAADSKPRFFYSQELHLARKHAFD